MLTHVATPESLIIRALLPRTIQKPTPANASAMEIQSKVGCDAIRGSRWDAHIPTKNPRNARTTIIRVVYAAPNRRSPYAIDTLTIKPSMWLRTRPEAET